jgi:hypothetical protein
VYFCRQICSEACFDKRQDGRKVEIGCSDSCIRYGACVVQSRLMHLHSRMTVGGGLSPIPYGGSS